ncbi:hypothetical protein V6N13_045617 [Hibiscus sabdariffa]
MSTAINPNITYVIETGRGKEMVFKEKRQRKHLKNRQWDLTASSMVQCCMWNQKPGRVGLNEMKERKSENKAWVALTLYAMPSLLSPTKSDSQAKLTKYEQMLTTPDKASRSLLIQVQ